MCSIGENINILKTYKNTQKQKNEPFSKLKKNFFFQTVPHLWQIFKNISQENDADFNT